jgi:hypothetical protein
MASAVDQDIKQRAAVVANLRSPLVRMCNLGIALIHGRRRARPSATFRVWRERRG